jgi:hypothetical protein
MRLAVDGAEVHLAVTTVGRTERESGGMTLLEVGSEEATMDQPGAAGEGGPR